MSYKDATVHRYSAVGQEYLVTLCTQSRTPKFENFSVARATIGAMRHLEVQKLATITAWVVMPDHLHLLLSLTCEKGLGHVVARLKIHSSRNAGMQIPWQKGFHERTLRSSDDRRDIARYIILNPVRAGLVRSIRYYPHWDSVYLDSEYQ
ncbi:transposase [Marinobacter nanhaiticus D15-8W]|uniref:REP-associated tyrosine transposase n=1 Tax=Marinobacter nanhaiticus TaxID=1305740 RepID=UPI0002C9B398|nr:transposase [Marinobacter nanhaiticus]BES71508.1 transposase [Marinobacter nanhaiticus D15-8W]